MKGTLQSPFRLRKQRFAELLAKFDQGSEGSHQPKLTSLPARSRAEQVPPLHLELPSVASRRILHKDDSPRGVHAYAHCADRRNALRATILLYCAPQGKIHIDSHYWGLRNVPHPQQREMWPTALHALEPRHGKVFTTRESW